MFCHCQRRLTREGKQHLLAIEALLPKIPTAATLEQLMGYEGTAAALYYRSVITACASIVSSR